jgi:hypothetical protein
MTMTVKKKMADGTVIDVLEMHEIGEAIDALIAETVEEEITQEEKLRMKLDAAEAAIERLQKEVDYLRSERDRKADIFAQINRMKMP